MKTLKISPLALVIFFIIISLGCQSFCFAAPRLPFKIGEKSFYQVHFNGVKVGKIEFEYKGRQKIDERLQDIIVVTSDVKILGLFEIESRENIYVDIDTNLVLKVEREVKFLGREESILEEYNQKDGWIKITQLKSKITQSRLIKRAPPIHNILILYFFYPLDLQDKMVGKTFEFNLPLRTVSIKVKESRKIPTNGGTQEVYLLECSTPRRVKIWLKKEERLPLRLEIPAFLGRAVILKI